MSSHDLSPTTAAHPAAGSMTGAAAPTVAERLQGGLLGLLIGDAVGVPYEFKPAHALPAADLIDMVPPAGFARSHAQVPPGTWSDDGAQALVLLEHLLANDGLDVDQFGQGLHRWLAQGFMAVDGVVFDCGIQTGDALDRIAKGTPATQAGGRAEHDNGNGSLMRVLPLALWFRARHGADADLEELVHLAHRQSFPTHGHPRSQASCALLCLWAWEMLDGATADGSWARAADRLARVYENGAEIVLQRELQLILSWGDEHAPSGSGYVVDTLWSARVALRQPSFREAIQAAVALGNDTDTTACVAGGLAGIRAGVRGLWPAWLAALRGKALVEPLLCRLAPQS